MARWSEARVFPGGLLEGALAVAALFSWRISFRTETQPFKAGRPPQGIPAQVSVWSPFSESPRHSGPAFHAPFSVRILKPRKLRNVTHILEHSAYPSESDVGDQQ